MPKDVKTQRDTKRERGVKPRRANGDKLLNWIFSFIISTGLFFSLVFFFNLFERGSVDIFYFITLEFYALLGTILLIMYVSDILGNILAYGIVWMLYVIVSKEGMIRSFWDLNKINLEKGLTNLFTRLFSSIILITGALWAVANQWLPEVTIPTIIILYIALKLIGKALSIVIVKSFM